MQRDVAAPLNLLHKTVWLCIAQLKLLVHCLLFFDEYPFSRAVTPEWATAGKIPSTVKIIDIDKYSVGLGSCSAYALPGGNISCPAAGEAGCFL